ncbi:Ubiquitin carboxyl-terminal hydrolase MINDY-2 [Lamellibrachia satsuma]|nr:Ubiquitin carboxyl-terminal hydrolase MINDY-2 [Lamellibrachia satsuma]
MQSDTTRLDVTAPVTRIPEDIAVDIANNASTDIVEIVLAKPVMEDMATEMTNCHNNTCSETPEAPSPGPVAMKTTCQSPADGAVAGPCNPHDTASQEHCLYQVKWINFSDTSVGIITQNENGSCPLLAVVNILTLQGKIKLPPTLEVVSSGQLMEYLADCIFEQTPPEGQDSNAVQLDYEQNRHDALAIFHKLQTGLDVNVKFSGVADFEYTPECIVFDLLRIRLVHGWLVDPGLPAEVTAIGNLSYNQLVEKIIIQKNSPRPELITEALIAEEFLTKTASQLTYCGLCELASDVNEEELCVFFRNNHFSTLYKHNSELFLLVTDQGYLTESKAVWETLGNVEGDGHFVDAEFHTYTKPALPPMISSNTSVSSDQQIDQDYLVALSLQEEQVPSPTNTRDTWQPDIDSDHALARRLQEEEDSRAPDVANLGYQQPGRHPAQYQGRSHTASGSASPGRSGPAHGSAASERERKKDNCTIL